MRKKYLGIFLLLNFMNCTTTVTDSSDQIDYAFKKEMDRSNDSAVVLYMNILDSSLIQNVRIVEYKAKVSNVLNSIAHLTYICEKYGGYLSRDKTKNDKLSIQLRRVQRDTSILISHYQTKSTVMMRIPHFYIDSALKEVDGNLMYIDYKYSKVNDSVMSRYSAYKFLGQMDNTSKGEENYFYTNRDGDIQYAKIIEEYINSYGAIILTIYQNPQTKMERIGTVKVIPEYNTTFWTQTKIELGQGLRLIEKVWYIVLRYWPILALVIISLIVLWINFITKGID